MNVVHADAGCGAAAATSATMIAATDSPMRRTTVVRIALRRAYRPSHRALDCVAGLRGPALAAADGGDRPLLSDQGRTGDPGAARVAGAQSVLLHLPRLPGPRRRLALRGWRRGPLRRRRFSGRR